MDVSLRAAAFVALGGALGCAARYVVGAALTRGLFPWGTLAVNLLGSFVIAILMFGAVARGTMGDDARMFLATGVLGGFTTMSSFAFETVALFEESGSRAAGYVALTVVGCLAMAFLGRAIARAVAGA